MISMAGSITVPAVAPRSSVACATIFPPASSSTTLLPLPCRPSLPASFRGLRLKQSLFVSGESWFREIVLLAASQSVGQGTVRFPALQVVNSVKRQMKSGFNSETNVLPSSTPSWDGTKALAVTEGVCIIVAAASYTTSVFHNKQISLVASSSAGESNSLLKIGDFSTWYVPALWAALVLNAILRAVQQKFSTKATKGVWEERSIKDFSLDQRVGKLEEDVQGVVTVAQMLSRHLEKLGVRFRATRQTLRDPIQEAMMISQKTSEVVNALASREEVLEKELQEIQQVLVAMQAQQVKQLELIVAGVTKNMKSQQISEERILKELSRRLGAETYGSGDIVPSVSILKKKGRNPPNGRKDNLMKDIGILLKGLVANEEKSASNSRLSEKNAAVNQVGNVQVGSEYPVEKQNGHLVPGTKEQKSKKSVYNPNTTYAEEDFWATTTAIPTESSAHLASAETETEVDVQPRGTSTPHSSTATGKLDSFFSSRKGVDIPQRDRNRNGKDFDNPGDNQILSQSGVGSSNGTGLS